MGGEATNMKGGGDGQEGYAPFSGQGHRLGDDNGGKNKGPPAPAAAAEKASASTGPAHLRPGFADKLPRKGRDML